MPALPLLALLLGGDPHPLFSHPLPLPYVQKHLSNMAPNNSKPSKKASAPSAAGIKKNDAPTASSVLAKLKNTAKSNLQSFEAADQHGVVKYLIYQHSRVYLQRSIQSFQMA